MNLELQVALIQFPGLEADQKDAVRMMCQFYELYPKIFPGRALPYRIPSAQKDPRRLYLFKCCLQSIKELKQNNGPEPRVWIIAQLKMLRLIDEQENVFLGRVGDALYGDKAWSRWRLFEFHSKKQASRAVATPAAPVNTKKIIESMTSTHKTLSENNFDQLLLDGKIRMWVRNGKISATYLSLHPKSVAFAKKFTWSAVGVDPLIIPGLNHQDIISSFEQITGLKPVGPNF